MPNRSQLLQNFVKVPGGKTSRCIFCGIEYKNGNGSDHKYAHLANCSLAPPDIKNDAKEVDKANKRRRNRKSLRLTPPANTFDQPTNSVPVIAWDNLSKEAKKYVHQSVFQLILDSGLPFSFMQTDAAREFLNKFFRGYIPQSPNTVASIVCRNHKIELTLFSAKVVWIH